MGIPEVSGKKNDPFPFFQSPVQMMKPLDSEESLDQSTVQEGNKIVHHLSRPPQFEDMADYLTKLLRRHLLREEETKLLLDLPPSGFFAPVAENGVKSSIAESQLEKESLQFISSYFFETVLRTCRILGAFTS